MKNALIFLIGNVFEEITKDLFFIEPTTNPTEFVKEFINAFVEI